MISGLKQTLVNHLKNIPGKRTPRKIVVIECDDWGGIRMPSKQVYHELLRAGIPVDKSRYTMYDTLADKDDLEQLFEVLNVIKDKNGKPAVMTPVINIANPDFERIRASGFELYVNEPFTTTLDKCNRHPETFDMWKKGINAGIFVPESHGREHISVQLWMQKLREGDEKVRLAFDHGFVSVDTAGVPEAARQFRPEFFFMDKSEIPFLENSIKSGIELFSELFGYIPRAFVPSNGIFHPVFEKTLAKSGVKYLYVSHIMPVPDGRGGLRKRYYPVGKHTGTGLTYYTRNCAFEPTDPGYQGIELTLQQMNAAFRWRKPAIISTHRVNFVGGLDAKNREKGLSELKKLLDAIVKTWPEVEFMSSAELFGAWERLRGGEAERVRRGDGEKGRW